MNMNHLYRGLLLTSVVMTGLGFTYNPAGQLISGSGTGRVDDTVYVPGMRFPIEASPAYANSQVYRPGGMYGPSGGQCDASNFEYPWQDNFCETRRWDMPMCPSGTGHQGQDIRAASCEARVHPTSATENGTITRISSYVVYLQGDSGTLYRYMHMDPGTLQVSTGDHVVRGQRLGFVSNYFGDTSTTVHLHFDMQQDIAGVGEVFAPTYMSLVRAYEELLGTPAETCDALPVEGGILDDSGPCFLLHGPAASWRYVNTTGWQGQLHWTYGWDGGRSNWAEWDASFEEAGSYLVEVYVTDGYNESQNVTYTVHSTAGSTDVVVSQDGTSRWISLGEYDFASGEPYAVEVSDDTGEASADQRHISADAVRFTRTTLPVEDTGPTDTGTPDTGTADAGTQDTGPVDTGTADTGMADTGTADTGTMDTGTMDTGAPDTSPPDTGIAPDTAAPQPDATTTDVGTQADVIVARTPLEVTVDPGCACASGPRRPPFAWGLLLAFVFARRSRRRR